MDIENFRLSNLTEKEVTDYINGGDCVILECYGNGTMQIKTHTGVRLCGTFTRGKCIQYDGLPTIPISEFKKYDSFFLCKTYNADSLSKELVEHYSSHMVNLLDLIKKHGSLETALYKENIIKVWKERIEDVMYDAPTFLVKLFWRDDKLMLSRDSCETLLEAVENGERVYVKLNPGGFDEIVQIKRPDFKLS